MGLILGRESERERAQRLLDEVLSHREVRKGLTFLGYYRAPELVIENANYINAAAFEIENRKKIMITSVALELSDEEVKAIFAHECCHLIHRDYNSNSLIALLLALPLSSLLLILSLKISVLLMLAMPLILIVYSVISYYMFQRAEHRADILAARVVGKEAVIQLMSRISYHSDTSLYSKFAARFSKHPSSQLRAARISQLK